MTVKFNVVERGNPANPTAPKKFYPSVLASGRLALRDLAREIGKISTVSSVDTLAVLEALLTVLPDELAKGNVVELGDFGSFWLRNAGEGCSSAKDVSAENITNLQPRFNAGRRFKEVLAQVHFEKAKGPVVLEQG